GDSECHMRTSSSTNVSSFRGSLSGRSQLCIFSSRGVSIRRFLPSFPTRRSSDLERFLSQLAIVVSLGSFPAVFMRSRKTAGKLRSEEHTSELQSLRHLVCRLLLEKKKNTARGEGRQTASRRSGRPPATAP